MRLGVITGTGTGFGVDGPTIAVDTPYGTPSGPIRRVDTPDGEVVTIQRHGAGHSVPPHRINYRANLWALRELGVERIVAFGAVGNLHPDWQIGDIVLCDQFVNRTWGREDTFFDGPEVRHAVVSEPYCADMRASLATGLAATGLTVRPSGVLLVIQGPRYSTRAENRDWRHLGYDVISMTHYPEVVLARELGLCFASLCLVTDHASVLGDPATPVGSDGHASVAENMSRSAGRVWAATVDVFGQLSAPDRCGCAG